MPATPTPTKSEELNKISEQIARRAFDLYEARGREDGHDLEDWLRAEKEIAEVMSKTASEAASLMAKSAKA